MICDVCNQEVKQGDEAIFGVIIDGRMQFGWTDDHYMTAAEVILGSIACVDAWLTEHPEHADALYLWAVRSRQKKAAQL